MPNSLNNALNNIDLSSLGISMNGAPSGGLRLNYNINTIINPNPSIPIGAMTASQHAVGVGYGVEAANPGQITSQYNVLLANKNAKSAFKAFNDLKSATGGFMNSKVGKFGGQYGGVIGDAASAIGDMIGKRGLNGKYGGITKGMDTAYDTIQKAASNFGPVGNIVSGAMGVGKLLGNAVSKIGGGTDGVTKTDAILNSAFLNLTPLGLINGFGGKRANTYTRNAELDKSTNGGFLGFLTTQDVTQIGAGKKYGLFSSGARNKQNQLTEFTSNMKHTISGIVDTNTINNLAAQGSTPFIANQQSVDLSGGVQQMRAARQGMKVEKYKKPANPFKLKLYSRPKGVKNLSPKPYGPEGMIQLYDKDGNPTRGLTRALELGYEPVIKYNGKAGFIGYDSNPALPYMLRAKNTILDKKGGQMIRRIVSKYLVGNKLKRTFKTIDVATGKYVEIPRDLDKDQIKGRKSIRLTNGTTVFMNGDGTVSSDHWESGERKLHLTPKGEKGLKTPRDMSILIDYANKQNPPFIRRINNNDRRSILLSDGTFGTHLLSYGELDGKTYVYPQILEIDGNLVFVQDDPLRLAFENGNVLEMSPEEADYFTKHYKEYYPTFFQSFKQGGQMNVIPEGALHARLNHLDLVNDDLTHVTTKGIPVITKEGGEVVQHAEIEHSEIIFTLDVTNKIEDLRKKWHEDKEDKYAIEAGKLLVKEILYNTDDRTNLIESVE